MDNDLVRGERNDNIAKLRPVEATLRDIVSVFRSLKMKEANDEVWDLKYWLSQPLVKRAEAVNFWGSQMLEKTQRLDKTIAKKIKEADENEETDCIEIL